MKAKFEVSELDIGELESLLESIQGRMGEGVAGPFRKLLASYVQLLEIIRRRELSLRKLQQLLFGAQTERTSQVLESAAASSAVGGGTTPEQETGHDAASSSAEATREGGTSSAPADLSACHAQAGASPEAPRRRRRGHGRHGAAAYVGCAKVEVGHAWLSGGDVCPSCGKGTVYVQRNPRELVRLVGQAPVGGTVYALERLRCNMCGEVFTAEAPEGVGEEKYDATVVSICALLRYGYGMAGNRLENLQESLGVPLPASTQWELVRDAADPLVPVFEYLILQGAQGEVVHNDDTWMRVLDLMAENQRGEALPEEGPERRGIFTSNVLSVGEDHSVALFFTGRRHAGENLREVLSRRAQELQPPIQMCDALSRNMPEDLRVILANCLSHGRRRFVEIAYAFPAEVRYVLQALKLVYQVDAEAKEEGVSPEERWRRHQQRSGPVMEALHGWLKEQLDEKKVEPNSSLGEAIRYMLKHWPELTLFLRQPGAPLDNNVCERALKRAILHRKNSLFYRTMRGAFVGDLYMSLIYTCFLCGADPFDYLTQLVRNHEQAARRPAEWMPWNYQKQRVGSGGEPKAGRGPPAGCASVASPAACH